MFLKIEKLYLCLYSFLNSRKLCLSLCIVTLNGCALDDIGLVKVRRFENETMFMIRKEAWGAYLSTEAVDGGFMIGHMTRIFLYPKNKDFKEIELSNLFSYFEQDQFIETQRDKSDMTNDGDPVAWVTNNQGLMLNANTSHVGLAVGQESRDEIKLPNDFNGVFIFNYSSKGKIKAYFRP